ncbi:MAG TPA: hypothetical protein VGI39_33775 [Polyangiaceae bacterium]
MKAERARLVVVLFLTCSPSLLAATSCLSASNTTGNVAAPDGGPFADDSATDAVAVTDAIPATDASPTDAGLDDAAPIASFNGQCVPDGGANAGPAPPTINFDQDVDGGAIPAGTLISTQYPGVTFWSTTCGGPIVSANGEAASPPNFLVGNPGSFSPVGFDLAAPVSKVGVTLVSVGAATVTATAYDATFTNVVATTSITHPGAGNGLGAHDPVTLAGAGIVRVVVAITTPYPGDGFGIDDVTF